MAFRSTPLALVKGDAVQWSGVTMKALRASFGNVDNSETNEAFRWQMKAQREAIEAGHRDGPSFGLLGSRSLRGVPRVAVRAASWADGSLERAGGAHGQEHYIRMGRARANRADVRSQERSEEYGH